MARSFLSSAPPLMVSYCVAMHVTWAMLIYIDPQAALGATATSILYEILRSEHLVIAALALSALQAAVAMTLPMPWNVVLLLPQQMLLLMSATGAISAMVAGHFADGVIRPRVFITADQLNVLLRSLAHALAIIAYGVKRER